MDDLEITLTKTSTFRCDYEDLIDAAVYEQEQAGRWPEDMEDLLKTLEYAALDFGDLMPAGEDHRLRQEAEEVVDDILEDWDDDKDVTPSDRVEITNIS